MSTFDEEVSQQILMENHEHAMAALKLMKEIKIQSKKLQKAIEHLEAIQ
jgi:hypothetical protein